MPSLNLDQNMLSAGASASAGDWAQAAANASVDFRTGVALKRGINLEAGVGVMGELSAALRYFLAADLNASAQASARLRGQIQVPLDLFDEAGFAVRLQAVAEASVSIRLGLGLSIREFLQLAQQTGQLDETGNELLVIFLEELDIQAGVSGKAAVAAMAYANLVMTGRLVTDPSQQFKPGFTISAEAGVGLKAGAGWQLFAHLGFKDTRRLVGRTIDVLVDQTVNRLCAKLPDDHARSLVAGLRAPAKIGLRCAFEVGYALYDQAPTFADNSDELARQCVRVVLEEAQKVLLEMISRVATEQFLAAIDRMGISQVEWDQTQPYRQVLASLLRSLPREPFVATPANLTYWTDLANAAVTLGMQLAGAVNRDEWAEPVSVIWSAAQLLIASVEKIVNVQTRVSFFGAVSATAQARAFEGKLPGGLQPPTAVRECINAALGRSADATVDQDTLMEFLVRDALLARLIGAAPEALPLLEIFAGPHADGPVAAAKMIMRNINAFIPKPDGSGFDPKESLRVIADSLEAYVDARLRGELQPVLQEELGDDPLARTYIDEVITPSLQFTTRTVIRRVLAWGTGALDGRDALREACSGIVLKVLSRSAVVTADVLVAAVMQQVGGELHKAADNMRSDNNAIQQLVDASGLDRELVLEIVEESLRIVAAVFSPQPPEVRAKIRNLMYELVDTIPESADESWVDRLEQDQFIPNERARAAIGELTAIVGEQVVTMILRFLNGVLAKVAELILTEIIQFAKAVGKQIEQWVQELAQLAADLLRRLIDLPAQIAALAIKLSEQTDQMLVQVRLALSACGTTAGRSALIQRLRDDLAATFVARLREDALYKALPNGVKSACEDAMHTAVNITTSDQVLQPLLQSLAPVADGAGAVVDDLRRLLADLRTINPNANVPAQIRNILLDRLTESMRLAWGGANPGIDLSFRFSYRYTPPKVWGVIRWTRVWYWPYWIPAEWGWVQPADVVLAVDFNLDRVELPLNQVVAMLRTIASGLNAFEAAVQEAAIRLIALLEAQDAHEAAQQELDLVSQQYAQVQQQLADASGGNIDITIMEPTPAALYEGDVLLDVLVPGVPRSYLGRNGLELQRLFVFLNGELLNLDDFEVQDHLPATGPTGKVTVLGIGRQVTAQLAGAKARLYTQGSTGMHLLSGVSKQDEPVERIGAAVIRGQDLNYPTSLVPSVKEAVAAQTPAGLRLRRRVTLSELHTGVNTLAVTVVTGESTQVTRAVSFLATRPAAPAITLGKRPTFAHLPANLRAVLAIAPEQSEPVASVGACKGEVDPFWLPAVRQVRAERLKAVVTEQITRCGRQTEVVRELREAVRSGMLRPVPDLPGDEAGPASRKGTGRSTQSK